MMITSRENKLIKFIYALNHDKKVRENENAYVVEGIKLIQELNDPTQILYLLISEDFKMMHIKPLADLESCLKIDLNVSSKKVFDSISTMQTPEGILAVVQKKKYDLEPVIHKKRARIFLLDSVSDPGNLGTIIRSADAFGLDGILLSKNSVELYNPKVVRSTMGSIFRVPIIEEVENVEYIKRLKENGFKILSTDLNSTSYIDEMDLKKNDKLCVVIGNESRGVSEEILEISDERVKIRMNGNAESLNVGIACSILIYYCS